MRSVNKFLLSLANTLAVGWFATIGGFYIETSKPLSEQNESRVYIVFACMIAVGIVTAGLYTAVGHSVFSGDELDD